MSKGPQLRQRQKMSIINKGVLVVAGTSIMGLAVYMTMFMNTTSVTNTKASSMSNMMLGYDLNNGEVVSSYDWNSDDPMKATKGPDAVKISRFAQSMSDGVDGTNGLSAGKTEEGINMEIPADNYFNTDGIDLSFDFKRTEETCNFFTRGKYFNFGMKKGKIIIAYKINLEKGRSYSVNETTDYEIPTDDEFRTLHFIYNPNSGKGEIMVNGVAVWNYQGPKEHSMFWKNGDNVIIGQDMNGGKTDRTILDNFVMRNTSHINELPITLLAFQAQAKETHVMISWFTARESDIDSFYVERSEDAIEYAQIGSVKAVGNSETLHAYAYADKQPLDNKIAYYRLVPSNKPLKSISVPVIGYRYRVNHPESTFKQGDYTQADSTK